MKTAALIDGDIIAYKHASAAEVPVEWEDDLWTLHADANEARVAIDAEIASIKETLHAEVVVVAVSDKGNFRKSLYPEYKANRAKTRKPLVLSAMRQHLLDAYDAYTKPGLEADDILGILATHPSIVRADRRVIVSIDKDFEGVPCHLWNPNTDTFVRTISDHAANRWHLIQTLTGDATDNYPGCPGIGPVKAAVLVDKALADSDPWSVIVDAFIKAGLTSADALLQARLARILRAPEYNFKTKLPLLWEPALLKVTPGIQSGQ